MKWAIAVAQKGSLSSSYTSNYHVRTLEWMEVPLVESSDLLDVEVLLHVGHLLPNCLDKIVMASNVRGHHCELLPIVSEICI